MPSYASPSSLTLRPLMEDVANIWFSMVTRRSSLFRLASDLSRFSQRFDTAQLTIAGAGSPAGAGPKNRGSSATLGDYRECGNWSRY